MKEVVKALSEGLDAFSSDFGGSKRISPTSVKAYREIADSGLLGRLQKEVYLYLAEHGPLTQNEVSKWGFPSYRHDSIKPRFAELRRMGVVEITGKRSCRVSGHELELWQAKIARPMKLDRVVTFKERVDRYLKFSEEGLDMAITKISKECAKNEETTKLLAYLQYTRLKIRESRGTISSRSSDT